MPIAPAGYLRTPSERVEVIHDGSQLSGSLSGRCSSLSIGIGELLDIASVIDRRVNDLHRLALEAIGDLLECPAFAGKRA